MEKLLNDPEFIKSVGFAHYKAHWGTLDRHMPRNVSDAATKPESVSVKTGLLFLTLMEELGYTLVKKD